MEQLQATTGRTVPGAPEAREAPIGTAAAAAPDAGTAPAGTSESGTASTGARRTGLGYAMLSTGGAAAALVLWSLADDLATTLPGLAGEDALLQSIAVLVAGVGAVLCGYLALTWLLASAVLLLTGTGGAAGTSGRLLHTALRVLAPGLARRVAATTVLAAAMSGLALGPAQAQDAFEGTCTTSDRAGAPTVSSHAAVSAPRSGTSPTTADTCATTEDSGSTGSTDEGAGTSTADGRRDGPAPMTLPSEGETDPATPDPTADADPSSGADPSAGTNPSPGTDPSGAPAEDPDPTGSPSPDSAPPPLGWGEQPSAPATAPADAEVPASEAASPAPAGPAATSAPAPVPPAERHVVVERGDSLWRITQEQLGPTADDAAIARAWPELYAANRDTIGADPDHIETGQRLIVPESLTTAAGPSTSPHPTDPTQEPS